MREGTIDLILFGLAFFGLQIWWISRTIKNGRRREVDKWGQLVDEHRNQEISQTKEKLEKIFRS